MGADPSSWAAIESGRRTGPPPSPEFGTSTTAADPQRVSLRRMPLLVLLDEGGRVIQRHAGVALVGSGILMVPGVVVSVLGARAVAASEEADLFDGTFGPLTRIFGTSVTADAQRVGLVLALLLGSLATAVIGGFVTEIVLSERFGRPVGLIDQFRRLAPRVPRLVGGWVIGHSWVWLALLIAGQSRPLGLVVGLLGLFLVPLFLYASPVLVAEGGSLRSALRRAVHLSSRRADHVFVVAIASAFVGLWLRWWLGAVPVLLESTGLVTFGSARWLIDGIAAQVGLVIGTPIVAAATALSFIDTRARLEGVDLLMALADP